MFKFHLTVLAVFGCGFFAGKNPTVGRRYYPPYSPASLTLLGRACEYNDGRVISLLPGLLIEGANIASAFKVKASPRSQPFEVGVR
jgi:hypothetical protein